MRRNTRRTEETRTGHPLMKAATGSSAKDAATQWFVRMQDTPVPESDKRAFHAWLDADPAHAEAYAELERVWAGLDQIDRHDPVPAPPSTAEHRRSAGKRRSLPWMSLAASILLLAGLVGYTTNWPAVLADYRTEPGEQRRVVLGDGSTVHLNTATAASAEFSAHRRSVTLHHGEAYFEIARNPERPFFVKAGSARVAVLGTAFSVKRTSDAVDIIVTKNNVRVSGPARRSTIVSAGQTIRVTENGLGTVKQSRDPPALAWRQGRLVFDTVPLVEVLAELERYRHGQIIVTDRSIESLPVTGSFSIARSDAALEAIEKTLPVRLSRYTDLLILVSHDSAR